MTPRKPFKPLPPAPQFPGIKAAKPTKEDYAHDTRGAIIQHAVYKVCNKHHRRADTSMKEAFIASLIETNNVLAARKLSGARMWNVMAMVEKHADVRRCMKGTGARIASRVLAKHKTMPTSASRTEVVLEAVKPWRKPTPRVVRYLLADYPEVRKVWKTMKRGGREAGNVWQN